jgi:hydrogenase 3 maturation protease
MDPISPLPPPLQQNLTAQLLHAREIAILAVGSDLYGDDAVALRVVELLKPHVGDGKPIHTFIGATAPENCTGPIRRLNPSHLIVIDAADLGKSAGTIELLDPEQLSGVTFCTHALPLNVVVDYILKACPDCKAVVLGVQPYHLDFEKPLSAPVEAAACGIADALVKALCA